MTDHVSRDWEFLWIWCGDEGQAKIIGPFDTQDDIERHIEEYRSFDGDTQTSGCEHDHISFRGTISQLAPKFLLEGRVSTPDDWQAPWIAAWDDENYRFLAAQMIGINHAGALELCRAVLDLRGKVAA